MTMDSQTVTSIAAAVVGTVGGGLTTGWIAKILISRFITRNDKRHDDTTKILQEVSKELAAIAVDMAVIRTTLGQVTAIKEQVGKDHDTLIKLETWQQKYQGDLVAQFGKIRDIEQRFDDLSRLISGLRRDAGNE